MAMLIRWLSKVNFRFLIGSACACNSPSLFFMIDAMSDTKLKE